MKFNAPLIDEATSVSGFDLNGLMESYTARNLSTVFVFIIITDGKKASLQRTTSNSKYPLIILNSGCDMNPGSWKRSNLLGCSTCLFSLFSSYSTD